MLFLGYVENIPMFFRLPRGFELHFNFQSTATTGPYHLSALAHC